MKFLRSPDHRQLLRRLTSARQRAGLNQTELADKVNASRGFAVKYESGEHGPIEGNTPSRHRLNR